MAKVSKAEISAKLKSESGASAVEWVILSVVMAAVIFFGGTLLSGALEDVFTDIGTSLDNSTTVSPSPAP